jgi:hypothetical protein
VHIAEQIESAGQADNDHNASLELVELLKQANINSSSNTSSNTSSSSSTDREHLVSRFMRFNQVATGPGTSKHVIFLLDESSSMSRSWGSLMTAFVEFLSIREGSVSGSGDIVSVVQFASRARLTLDKVSLADARQASSSLRCKGGGTLFVPVLNLAECIVETDISGLDVVVLFMTDGFCGDSDQCRQKTESLFQSCSTTMQFFGVAFNTDGSTLADMANAVGGSVVSARDVNELEDQFKHIAREVSVNQGRR